MIIDEDEYRPSLAAYRALAAENERLKLELALRDAEELSDREEDISYIRRTLGVSPQLAVALMRLYRGRNVAYVTIEQLLSTVYGADSDQRNDVNVKVLIHKLRAKLGARCIETEWGKGYRLTDAGVRRVESAFHRKQGRAA